MREQGESLTKTEWEASEQCKGQLKLQLLAAPYSSVVQCSAVECSREKWSGVQSRAVQRSGVQWSAVKSAWHLNRSMENSSASALKAVTRTTWLSSEVRSMITSNESPASGRLPTMLARTSWREITRATKRHSVCSV